jgi:hypothetical protein
VKPCQARGEGPFVWWFKRRATVQVECIVLVVLVYGGRGDGRQILVEDVWNSLAKSPLPPKIR